jgi:hypothetical protein
MHNETRSFRRIDIVPSLKGVSTLRDAGLLACQGTALSANEIETPLKLASPIDALPFKDQKSF